MRPSAPVYVCARHALRALAIHLCARARYAPLAGRSMDSPAPSESSLRPARVPRFLAAPGRAARFRFPLSVKLLCTSRVAGVWIAKGDKTARFATATERPMT